MTLSFTTSLAKRENGITRQTLSPMVATQLKPLQVEWAARAASPELVNNRFFDGQQGVEPPVEVRCIVSPHADRNAPRGT